MKKIITFIILLISIISINKVAAMKLEVDSLTENIPIDKDTGINTIISSAVDSKDNLIVSGYITWKGKIEKYNSKNELLWETVVSESQDLRSIAFDSKENIYILTSYEDDVPFEDEYTKHHLYKSYILVINPKSGEIINRYKLGNSNEAVKYDKIIIEDDHLYAIGYKIGNYVLTKIAGEYEGRNQYKGEKINIIGKYDLNFNEEWRKELGSKKESTYHLIKKAEYFGSSATAGGISYYQYDLKIKDDKILCSTPDGYAMFDINGKKIFDNDTPFGEKTTIYSIEFDDDNNYIAGVYTSSSTTPLTENSAGQSRYLLVKTNDKKEILKVTEIGNKANDIKKFNNGYIVSLYSKKILLCDKKLNIIDTKNLDEIIKSNNQNITNDTNIYWVTNTNNTITINGRTTEITDDSRTTKPIVLTANIYYELLQNAKEEGKIEIDKEKYYAGDKVTITVTPNEGYKFIGIEGLELKDNKDGTYEFIMPSEDIELIPIFEKETIIDKVVSKVEQKIENPNTGDIVITIFAILLLSIVTTFILKKRKLSLE